MPTIQYSNNPNSDTAFVVQDGGQKNRAVLTAEPAGTLQLSDSANVSTGYVTDEDGKKHKVNLVAQLEGEVEFSENPNSTKGYVTDEDGKKHRVVLTASLAGGGSAPVIDELNVTPSTSAQQITAPEGTDGYNPVNVAAVTSSIDANITAGNIKKDVSILGVTGSYEGNIPTGTLPITANGVYDVTNYASADVNVPGAPAHYVEKTVNASGKLINSTNIINLNGVTDVGNYALAGAYANVSFPANTTVDLSSLTTVSGFNAFLYAFVNSNIQGIDLSSLTTISGSSAFNYAFAGNSSLTSINLSSLTTVAYRVLNYTFLDCTGLTSVDLSSLTTVGTSALNNLFAGCTNLTSVNVSGVKTIDSTGFDYAFSKCSKLGTVNFYSVVSIGAQGCRSMMSQCKAGATIYCPALKTVDSTAFESCFNGTLNGVIYIPSNITTNIQYSQGTVYRTLPSTAPLTGANAEVYDRNPVYDTGSSLGWRIGDDWNTPFYTSGTTSPSVGDTIYSDAACTVPVTTISSIS